MAGGFSSQWTTMGSNSNSSVDSGTSGGGTTGTLPSGISNHQTATGASGTNNQVRRECTVWNVDTDDFSTPAFNWRVNSDFTVVVNGAGQSLALDPGAVEVDIEGSIDGSNWIQMKDMGDWSPGTGAVVGTLIYDYDANGVMPYMRVTMNSANDVDNGPKPFKVNVFPHTI